MLVRYRIEDSRPAVEHLRVLSAGQRALVMDTVDRQLTVQPAVATRNPKPLRPNRVAPWALRIRNLRVYYAVNADPADTVIILAVGVKERDRIRIGGRVVEL